MAFDKDYGPVRFIETVLLILSVLSLGMTALALVGLTTGKSWAIAMPGVFGGVVAAAIFYTLYIVVSLARDTNEKISALWRSREVPPPADFPRCSVPGCKNAVYSSSTGLCREHFREAHPEEEEQRLNSN
jgi:hypothetical protein